MDALLKDIKFNCDVSDARYWGHFTICGLLMRYRDLFRSEMGLTPWSTIPRQDIAAWIGSKESLWSGLEGSDFKDLTIRGVAYSPFDSDGINRALQGDGCVYGAGYGMYLKPTFFLGQVRSVETIDGHTVHTTDRESVRDLLTSPAMLQERSVFIRLEPFRTLLWEKFTELRPDCGPALCNAFREYGVTPGQSVNGEFALQLERMALACSGILLRHELAESKEAAPQWKELLTLAEDRKTEHFLRAVNDLVADTSDAGPLRSIVDTRDHGGLSLFIGLIDGYRRLLFPEVREAYGRFLMDGSWDVVEEARRNGHDRFLAVRRKVLELFAGNARDHLRKGLGEMLRAFD